MSTSVNAAAAPAAAAREHRTSGLLLGLCGVVIALGVWTLLSRWLATGGGVINRLPPPWRVASEIVAYARGDLVRDLAFSLRVFVTGWIAGAACATVFGLLLGRVKALGQVFIPVIEAIRPVSSIAWVPLSIVWFGFGLTSKAFLVGLAVFLVVIVYAVDGARRIPPELDRIATMLGMRGARRFFQVVLPGTLTEVLIGSRVSLMAGWGTVIVAELVAADSGLGAHLIGVQQSYNVPAVMATMAYFGVTGFAMNALFTLAERRLTPWVPRAEETR